MIKFGKRTNQEPKRTASPSGSAKVFSYYTSGNRETPRSVVRNQPVKQPFSWHRLPSFFAAVAIFVSVLYVLSLDSNPRVVILSGQQQANLLQQTETYERAAQDILDNSLLSRTKLTINTDHVARQLMEQYPELASVAVTVPVASHRLVFELAPVQPALILGTGSGAYVVDMQGKAVVPTKDVPGLQKLALPQLTDESGLDVQVGTGVLPTDDVTFITEVTRQLSDKEIEVDAYILPPLPNEFHVRPAGEGYYVKFNMKGDARLQAGTYLALKDELSKSNEKPKEYIISKSDNWQLIF